MYYEKQLRIPFSFVDAAGILFFARVGDLFHQVYEDWWTEFADWQASFASSELALPLVSWQVTYKEAVKAGDIISIRLHVEDIGKSSFQLESKAFTGEGRLLWTTRSTHVFVDKKTGKSLKIPNDRYNYLQKYQPTS